MLAYDLLAFVAMALVALGAALAIGRRAGWYGPALLAAGVALRIFGALVRHEIIFLYYDGYGDAVLYFENARTVLARSGLASLLDPTTWFGGPRWWGTAFLTRATAVVVGLFGPTLRGTFLVFSLLSFAGLYAAAKGFQFVGPARQVRSVTLALWLWPSLWFWPSSIGKEALIVLAIGLCVYGHAHRTAVAGWLAYALGFGTAFCVRPHVAAVLALSTLAAYWLGSWRKLNFRRLLEALAAIAVSVVALQGMTEQFGIDPDLEGVREFVEFRSDLTLSGGSQIGPVGLGLLGIPMAFVNVWLRPFPWEAHNLTSLIAAGEIALLWAIVVRRRREVAAALRYWRSHRLLQLAIPFLVGYTLMIGLTFANLGIIARQRSPAFLFAFIVVLAAPAVQSAAGAERPGARRTPQPPPAPAERPGARAAARAGLPAAGAR